MHLNDFLKILFLKVCMLVKNTQSNFGNDIIVSVRFSKDILFSSLVSFAFCLLVITFLKFKI